MAPVRQRRVRRHTAAHVARRQLCKPSFRCAYPVCKLVTRRKAPRCNNMHCRKFVSPGALRCRSCGMPTVYSGPEYVQERLTGI